MSSPYQIRIHENLRTSFVLDENKCVACQACVLACAIENETGDILWRTVHSFNEEKRADLPVFYLSVACNQCEDAPCMSNCPAVAYSRDWLTGAVLHVADKCIGCRYCTWACPYDAPKFNETTHVVEKCNFCVERLHEGLKPACATACPTGALDVIQIDGAMAYPPAPAFNDFGISPSLQVIPLSENRKKPDVDEATVKKVEIANKKQGEEIKFKNEYPLAIFSFLMAFLVGAWGGVLRFENYFSPAFFVVLLGIAFGLSTLHLGKPARAWRAVLNFRSSWLSREIVFSSLFAAGAIIYLWLFPYSYLGATVQIIGFIALWAIDKVYLLTYWPEKIKFHSAGVVLSGFLFWAMAIENYMLFYSLLVLKLISFVYRALVLNYLYKKYLRVWGMLRILFGISGFFITQSFVIPLFVWLMILAAEFIDRALFYEDIENRHFSLK